MKEVSGMKPLVRYNLGVVALCLSMSVLLYAARTSLGLDRSAGLPWAMLAVAVTLVGLLAAYPLWLVLWDRLARRELDASSPGMYTQESATTRHLLGSRTHRRTEGKRTRVLLLFGDRSLVQRCMPTLLEKDSLGLNGGRAHVVYGGDRDGDRGGAGAGADDDSARLATLAGLSRRGRVQAVVHLSEALPEEATVSYVDEMASVQWRCSRAFRHAAPAYAIRMVNVSSFPEAGACEVLASTWARLPFSAAAEEMAGQLERAGAHHATRGLAHGEPVGYMAELSQYLGRFTHEFAESLGQWSGHERRLSGPGGVVVAPLPPVGHAMDDRSYANLWQILTTHSRAHPGRPVGFTRRRAFAWSLTATAFVCMAATVWSYVQNHRAILAASAALDTLAVAGPLTEKAQALDTLQKQLATLDHHATAGAPWLSRFGLNVDEPLRDALWPRYAIASRTVLVDSWQRTLEQRLKALSSRSHLDLAAQGDATVKTGYDDLKTYLMLTQPEHVDPGFLTTALDRLDAPVFPADASITHGAWHDLRHRLTRFHVAHLATPPDVAADLTIKAQHRLTQAARQTLVGVIGLQNAADTVYETLIDEAGSRFAPVTLAGLLGDSRSEGVFDTDASLPGVFTRTAWDEYISKAIDEAAESRHAGTDWVLADPRTAAEGEGRQDLREGLRQRYFREYAQAWERFLNSIRWQSDRQLSGTVDQLAIMGDPQRSPLAALFKAIGWHAQAGRAVPRNTADSLLGRAQQMVTEKLEKAPGATGQAVDTLTGGGRPGSPTSTSPLAEAFAPLLQLAPVPGDDVPGTPGDLSLQRYMERITGTRLALQQVVASPDADAQARVMAQAILQGRTSALAESLDYGRRTAASLGSRWAGFGDAMFRDPLEQSWQVILAPAATNLNATWDASIVSAWKGAFDGRYPFADSDNDASLPTLARFLRSDTGVVPRFVHTQLAGVLEKHGDTWREVQATTAGNGLTVDPAFIDALNRLETAAATLFASGDARVPYELRAVPTPGIEDMAVILDGQQLHYFNQRERWVPFVWPGAAIDNHARVQWQTTTTGMRTGHAYEGRFALIRLLEQAQVEARDQARSLLTWTPDIGNGTQLRVEMRAETGDGPLAALLLRHFELPSRIFITEGEME